MTKVFDHSLGLFGLPQKVKHCCTNFIGVQKTYFWLNSELLKLLKDTQAATEAQQSILNRPLRRNF